MFLVGQRQSFEVVLLEFRVEHRTRHKPDPNCSQWQLPDFFDFKPETAEPVKLSPPLPLQFCIGQKLYSRPLWLYSSQLTLV